MQARKFKNSIAITAIIIKTLVISLLGLLFAASSYTQEEMLKTISIILPFFIIYLFWFMRESPWKPTLQPKELNVFLFFLSLTVLLAYMMAVVLLMLYRHDVGEQASSQAMMYIGLAEIFLAIYSICMFIFLKRAK